MALQDLTPQLRTRLSRMERLVGLFVSVATLLLIGGLSYYVYHVAQRKGWFLTKVPYFTFVRNAAGLKVGDKVKLMGFDVGEILEITPQPPDDVYFNVYLRFRVHEPFYGYLWEDSRARVAAADFLGNRYIEVTKGTNGHPTYLETNAVITGIWNDKTGGYDPFTKTSKGYYLLPQESPALTERLEKVVNIVEAALPQFLDLTNKLSAVLGNAASAASRADGLMADARPIVTNLAVITANLRDPKGSLGEWLLPPELHTRLQQTLLSANTALASANTAVTNTDARLALLVGNLNLTLENLANLTSNLHSQVAVNTNLVSSINKAITDADDLVQGLKRHWLLRSAFKEKKTNAPPAAPLRSPRATSRP